MSFFVADETASLLAELRDSPPLGPLPVYLVGGFVRDGLRGRATEDIDLVLAGEAGDTARRVADALGGSFVPLDEAHKIARVVLTGARRGFCLDFAAMRGSSIEEDLGERAVYGSELWRKA